MRSLCARSTFHHKYLEDLQIDQEKNMRNTNTMIHRLTAMARELGYSKIADMCWQAQGDLVQLKSILKEEAGALTSVHMRAIF